MKEKISSFLKSEINIPIPNFVKTGRFKFMLQELPKKEEIVIATKTFSSKEKIFFVSFATVFFCTAMYILWKTNENYLVERPVKGGTVAEGVADIPRFINPLLATGEADRDLSALVYSGLLRPGDKGRYINDLAESYDVSKDGLVYTFKIKEDAVWHDGRPVTSDDVEFTILKAKDPIIRSPKRASFEGVTPEKINSKEIRFILKQPFQSFLENMTIGIIPKHLWKNIDPNLFVHSELNMRAMGSGPYKIKSISRLITSGTPEYIEMVPFEDFTLGTPKVSKIIFRFYSNQEKLYEAYKNGEIKSMSAVSPNAIESLRQSGDQLIVSNLPRVLAVFYNQSESKALADKSARAALDTAIDKEAIIKEVLLGYGAAIDSPVPPNTVSFTENNASEELSTTTATTTEEIIITNAKEILEKGGWKLNAKTGLLEKSISKKETIALKFTLATVDITELKKATEIIKNTWEKIGAKVDLLIYEKGDLDRNVIEPRKYDALFFGEIVGRDLDLFSFWHSSQKKSPGVNISLYSNTKADKAIESLRSERDDRKRSTLLETFEEEIKKDIPATFVYSPYFLYLAPAEIKNINIIPPITASDRFLNVYEWYINTEKVWKIFN